jgi:hypothetical protein
MNREERDRSSELGGQTTEDGGEKINLNGFNDFNDLNVLDDSYLLLVLSSVLRLNGAPFRNRNSSTIVSCDHDDHQ